MHINFNKHIKKILLGILGVTLTVTALLLYLNSLIPPVVLSENTTYYLPGQRNNCLWIMRLDNDIRDIPGDSSQIRIGIPAVENRGYLGGKIEVGSHQNLMMVFSPMSSPKNSLPVLLTGDYSGMELPIDTIRFRWSKSSAITVLLFRSRNKCLASRVDR